MAGLLILTMSPSEITSHVAFSFWGSVLTSLIGSCDLPFSFGGAFSTAGRTSACFWWGCGLIGILLSLIGSFGFSLTTFDGKYTTGSVLGRTVFGRFSSCGEFSKRITAPIPRHANRSEERRVGKECRSR